MTENKYKWGKVTPDKYDKFSKNIYYYYNLNLCDELNVKRVVKFVVSRIMYYEGNLPKGSFHLVYFDIRGQVIIDEKKDMFKSDIIAKLKSLNSEIKVSITFYDK